MPVTRHISAAFLLLTRLPVPARWHGAVGAEAAWAWPLAGLGVGLVAGLIGMLALMAGLPPSLAAGLALMALILATGALHEDGLADTADGLWGARTPARRLEIMRDSRIGTYGTLALILSCLLRWQALTLCAASGDLLPALVIVATLSRAPMAAVMSVLPAARSDGLSRLVGRPAHKTAGLGALVAILLILLLWPGALIWLILAATLPTIWLARLAQRRLGGQTGDILGATQQITELASLMVLVALI